MRRTWMPRVCNGRKAFILELAYGCVVEINDQLIPQEHVHPILMIEVPRQLFPFVRQLVADITGNGGFPPLTRAAGFRFRRHVLGKFGAKFGGCRANRYTAMPGAPRFTDRTYFAGRSARGLWVSRFPRPCSQIAFLIVAMKWSDGPTVSSALAA